MSAVSHFLIHLAEEIAEVTVVKNLSGLPDNDQVSVLHMLSLPLITIYMFSVMSFLF